MLAQVVYMEVIKKLPFSERDNVDHPIQLYAATKRSNELMAHSYSYLFGLPTTGLRFFTVYGPWGRPDMALFKFTNNMLQNKKIDIFNHGKHTRDFTYIDDITKNIIKLLKKIPKKITKKNFFQIQVIVHFALLTLEIRDNKS